MAPASGWGRAVGNTRSFVGNALGGLRGWSNLASWTVAGTLAYYLWVKPARQLQKEQEVTATFPALTAAPFGVFNLVGIGCPQITSEGGCCRLVWDRSIRACEVRPVELLSQQIVSWRVSSRALRGFGALLIMHWIAAKLLPLGWLVFVRIVRLSLCHI